MNVYGFLGVALGIFTYQLWIGPALFPTIPADRYECTMYDVRDGVCTEYSLKEGGK